MLLCTGQATDIHTAQGTISRTLPEVDLEVSNVSQSLRSPMREQQLTRTFVFLARNTFVFMCVCVCRRVCDPLPGGIKLFGLGRPTRRNLYREINLFRSFIETLRSLDYRSHRNLTCWYTAARYGYVDPKQMFPFTPFFGARNEIRTGLPRHRASPGRWISKKALLHFLPNEFNCFETPDGRLKPRRIWKEINIFPLLGIHRCVLTGVRIDVTRFH